MASTTSTKKKKKKMISNSTLPSSIPPPRKVCFSFAAYSKTVIDHLKSCEVPILEGLTDEEFISIEKSFNFKFPPDLRSILSEGLPVGPGFPNWRSSSSQQIKILINLPILEICKEISKKKFWCNRVLGDQPDDMNQALTLAKQILKKAPVLVPIYRHCYIPSISPNLAGNPVFYIKGSDLRYLGFDVSGFFQKVEFRHYYKRGDFLQSIDETKQTSSDSCSGSSMKAPIWAANDARKIEFWSDLVESVKIEGLKKLGFDLGKFFEEMRRDLINGGFTEEEVTEMTTKTKNEEKQKKSSILRDKESVIAYTRLQSLKLLRAGWTNEDVAYSFGFDEQD